jgi:hypothetical protein
MNSRVLMFITTGLIVAAGLFLVLRPAPPPGDPVIVNAPAPPAGSEDPSLPAPLPSSFDFVVRNGERVAGPVSMQAREGDDVSIKVTSDRADELHLHGYDLHVQVKPNEPVALFLKATHSGRFEAELHQSGITLGALEVTPR